ncbi:MAG: flagellar hook-associated protein FlgK [Planctomycetota bacterium]
MERFDIGLTALRAQQKTLSVLGNNLANAATPGFHRQRVELAARPPLRNDNLRVGAGVDVVRVTRLRSTAIETALLRNSSELADAQRTQDIVKQIESLLTPGEATIHDTLSTFFNRLEKISNSPENMTVRQEFLSSAEELMEGFNRLNQQLSSLHRDVRLELDDAVKEGNQLINDIAELNSLIFQYRATSDEPNDLLDRRDQLLGRLAELTEVNAYTREDGREEVLVAGGAILVGSRTTGLQVRDYSDGTTSVTVNNLRDPVPTGAGELNAMTTALSKTIPEFQNRLRELSRQIVREIDQQHAQGMSDQGPYSVLLGARSVKDESLPLDLAGTQFPVESGNLYITVTEDATGLRRTSQISIDTSSDSLNDVAAQLNTVTGVIASVDPVRKTLMISAAGPYSIDFAGRPDNRPDLTGMMGTTIPSLSGLYAGRNDQWTVTFSGAGQIGVTDGLLANIQDSAGQIIATQDVGKGYEAGTAFNIGNGVSLSFSSGTVTAPDTFSAYMVGDSDETKLLAAIGINSLFTGSEPGTYSLRTDLRMNPERMATTASGLPGDAVNVARMADLRDLRIDALGGRTYVEEIADVSASAGLGVQLSESQSMQLDTYKTRLETDRDSVSGVDINQEMLEMMQAQRAFQAAARYLQTTDQMLEVLFTLSR